MRNICVNIPKPLFEMLNELVEEGLFSNRAEAVRTILQIGVIEYLKNMGLEDKLSEVYSKHNKTSTFSRINKDRSLNKKKTITVAVKMPCALIDLLDYAVDKLDLNSRSYALRFSVVNFLRQFTPYFTERE